MVVKARRAKGGKASLAGGIPAWSSLLFFSSYLLSRAGSGWSCFTGQFPGMCHLYIPEFIVSTFVTRMT